MDTQYRRILVPLDGSDVAKSAIPVAQAMGRLFGSELSLVAVLPETARGLHIAGLTTAATRRSRRAENVEAQERAVKYLQEVSGELEAAGLKTTNEACINSDAATEIVLAARDRRSQLIVMATRGRSGLVRGLLGSVTDRVIHSSPIPVLVVPSPTENVQDGWAPKAVVAPLDGSELAEKSLPHIDSICRESGASIRLVRAVPFPTAYGGDPFGGFSHAVLATSVEESKVAERYLGEVATRLRKRGHTVEAHAITGHPRTEITRIAHEVPGAMVVMTTRGSSGLTRWVMGSVADGVIRSSGVPVLIIPHDTGV